MTNVYFIQGRNPLGGWILSWKQDELGQNCEYCGSVCTDHQELG